MDTFEKYRILEKIAELKKSAEVNPSKWPIVNLQIRALNLALEEKDDTPQV